MSNFLVVKNSNDISPCFGKTNWPAAQYVKLNIHLEILIKKPMGGRSDLSRQK